MAQRANAMDEQLEETALVDFHHPSISDLVLRRGWTTLDEKTKIRSVYDFVRDEILFGYNMDDAIPASEVLADGYGQCNTKGILFMALLRAVGVRCRFHGFTIDKRLQKGALIGLWYRLAPEEIVHSWVELFYDGRWIDMEGFILDLPYLRSVQRIACEKTGAFCGYGVATSAIESPRVFWDGNATYIQKEGIVRDFGIYPDPDSFFKDHSQPMGSLKRLVFMIIARWAMNRQVSRIRARQ